MTTPVGPGFYRMSKNQYLLDPCERPSLSSSIASLLVSRSPAHAFAAHPMLGGHRKDPTEAMVNGTIIDSLLVGGDTELVESPYDEYRSNEAKAWRDAQLAAGKQPVKGKEMRLAKTAVDAIKENLGEQGILLDGEHQVTAIWEQGETLCRARLDHWKVKDGIIYDLKTTENAHPDAVAAKMHAFGYDIQWAAYTAAVETIFPEWAGRVQMAFIFAETEPPYATLVVPPAGTMRAVGKFKWEKAVRLWGECLKSKKWPSYVAPIGGIEAKQWALAELENAFLGGNSVPF